MFRLADKEKKEKNKRKIWYINRSFPPSSLLLLHHSSPGGIGEEGRGRRGRGEERRKEGREGLGWKEGRESGRKPEGKGGMYVSSWGTCFGGWMDAILNYSTQEQKE